MSEKPQYAPQYPQQPQYTQQPMGMPQMAVPASGGNRNAKGKPMVNGEREWSNGMCDCFGDCGTCCMAFWCPCVVYGQNKQRLEHLNRNGFPDPEHGGCCSGDCWVHGLITSFCGLGWILQIGLRGNVRGRYAIKGGGCGDCCSACWCTPCELTQGSREIELEEQSLMGQHHHH